MLKVCFAYFTTTVMLLVFILALVTLIACPFAAAGYAIWLLFQ